MKTRIKMSYSPAHGTWRIWSPNNKRLLAYDWGCTVQESIDGFRNTNQMFGPEELRFDMRPQPMYSSIGDISQPPVSGFYFQCTNRPSMWGGWGETEKEALHAFFYMNKPKYLWMLSESTRVTCHYPSSTTPPQLP